MLDNVVVLASGSLQFLPVVEHLRPTKMIFAVDVYFPRMGLRDCTRLYRSTAIRKVAEGYLSAIMRHADFGGATNAVHLVLTTGIDIPIPSPASTVPRILKHFVNAAARGASKLSSHHLQSRQALHTPP